MMPMQAAPDPRKQALARLLAGAIPAAGAGPAGMGAPEVAGASDYGPDLGAEPTGGMDMSGMDDMAAMGGSPTLSNAPPAMPQGLPGSLNSAPDDPFQMMQQLALEQLISNGRPR